MRGAGEGVIANSAFCLQGRGERGGGEGLSLILRPSRKAEGKAGARETVSQEPGAGFSTRCAQHHPVAYNLCDLNTDCIMATYSNTLLHGKVHFDNVPQPASVLGCDGWGLLRQQHSFRQCPSEP